MLDHTSVVEFLVNFVFPQSVLDVVIFDLIAPAVVEVVNFASNFAAGFNVECLVYL